MTVEQLPTVVLLENFINQGAVLIGENNIFDAPNRFFDSKFIDYLPFKVTHQHLMF